MKRVIAIFSVLALVGGCAYALADGAPSSQFYFKGWPYRQDVFHTAQPAQTRAPAAPTEAPSPRPTAFPTAAPSTSTADYTTISVSAQEQKVWNLLNADRQKNGLSALPLDGELSRIARIKAEHMRDNRYFAHESPTYGSAAAMLKTFGYAYNGVGENIAHHANIEKSEAAFMSSAGHRRNILGSQWTKVGVGVSFDKNGFVYVVQLFAR